MTDAAIRIVLYHTDGHSVWLAPWAVYVAIALWALWALVVVASLAVSR